MRDSIIRERVSRVPIWMDSVEDGRTFLLLLGENAGMRAGVNTNSIRMVRAETRVP
jgi:hypothetical protein